MHKNAGLHPRAAPLRARILRGLEYGQNTQIKRAQHSGSHAYQPENPDSVTKTGQAAVWGFDAFAINAQD
jgi:hypothetical protein